MEDFVVRLREELEQLLGRMEKLEGFLETDPFQRLEVADRVDLRYQHTYMKQYATVLQRRLARIEARH